MAEDKTILIDVSIDEAALKTSRERAVAQVVEFDKKLTELREKRQKELKALETALASGNEKEVTASRQRLALNESETKSVQQSRREQIKVVQLSNDLITQSDGKTLQSKEQLRKARALEQIQLDQLKGTLAENAQGQIVLSKAGEQSVQQLNKYNTGLIEFGKSVNDGRNNVGNYTNSIIDAVDKTGLLGGSLGTVRDALNAVKSGAAGVSDGMAKVREGFSESVAVVKDWFVTNTDAGDALTDTGTSAEKATGSIQKVGTVGVSSMRALTAAIASTGIGLLVIALAAALNYLRQVDPIVEKFEQLFSGIGEAITVVGKGVVDFGKDLVEGLTNPIKLLETLNPFSIVDRFTEVGKEAVKAGQAAASLTERLQNLEDIERDIAAAQSKNNIESEKNRRLSEDRTKSAKERLAFLERAQDAELANLELEKKVAAERFAITKAEFEAKKALRTVSDELRKKLIDEATLLTELNAKIQNKAATDAADGAKLRLKAQKDYLTGVIAILNEELRAAELQGQSTIELKRRILRQQRDAELAESDLSREQRIAIERKYQNDLLALEQEFSDQREALQRQIDELAVNRITDGRTREIAAEALALEAKLDAIKGNSEKEAELRVKLAEESALKIAEINRKYDELSTKERAEVSKNNLDLITSDINKGYEKQKNALDIALAGQEISQQEYSDRIAALNEAMLQELLGQQLKYQADRQAQDQLQYQKEISDLDKLLADKKIAQEQYNSEKLQIDKDYYAQQEQTEIETQSRVNDTLNQLGELRLENEKRQAEDSVKTAQDRAARIAATEQALIGVASSSIQAIGDLLSQDEKNRKKNANVLKGLAGAEVLLNLYQEISNYWKAESTKGAAGAIIAGGLTAAATIRAVAAIAKISAQKFAVGGFTDMVSNSFAGGGNVRSPRVGLIGEAGPEYVAPNWQMNQAPGLFDSLERWRRTRVKPFELGGFTTVSNFLYNTPAIIPQQNMFGADFASQITDAVIRGMQLAPAPIVGVQEIIDVNNRIVNVQQTASL